MFLYLYCNICHVYYTYFMAIVNMPLAEENNPCCVVFRYPRILKSHIVEINIV